MNKECLASRKECRIMITHVYLGGDHGHDTFGRVLHCEEHDEHELRDKIEHTTLNNEHHRTT